MANAPRDSNLVPALLLTNGTAAVPAICDTAGRIIISTGTAAAGTNKTVGVGVAAVEILAANPARRGVIVVNNTAVDCYVGFVAGLVSGAAAALTGGSLLGAGGSMSLSYQDGYLGPIYAITDAGNTVVAVLEW